MKLCNCKYTVGDKIITAANHLMLSTESDYLKFIKFYKSLEQDVFSFEPDIPPYIKNLKDQLILAVSMTDLLIENYYIELYNFYKAGLLHNNIMVINNVYKGRHIQPSSMVEIECVDENPDLKLFFSNYNEQDFSPDMILFSETNNIPFIIDKQSNVYYGNLEYCFSPHIDILYKHNLNSDDVLKYEYWTSKHTNHNNYDAEGFNGLEASKVYSMINMPFELKYSHIKAIEEFIRKAENNEL